MKSYGKFVLAGIAGAVALASFTSPQTPAPASVVESVSPATQSQVATTPVAEEKVSVQPTQVAPAATTYTPVTEQKSVPLSNDNYYTNSAGDEIHSPAYAPSQPVGASARCRDGTYSFSASRRGTCSHHGGVAEWL